jgi:hypothetical protein
VANIGTWHWTLICVINAIWYAMILIIQGNIDDFGHMEEEEGGVRRRQLGGAAVAEPTCAPQLKRASGVDVTCDSGVNVSAGDLDSLFSVLQNSSAFGLEAQCNACVPVDAGGHALSAEKTLLYGMCFAAVGWAVLVLQLVIVWTIRKRMSHVLEIHGAKEDDHIVDLLRELNEKAVKAKEWDYEARHEDGVNDEDDETHVNVAVYADVVGGDEDDVMEDHIMYFKGRAGVRNGDGSVVMPRENKDSNSIMSQKTFGNLIFATKFLQARYHAQRFCRNPPGRDSELRVCVQLVTDFYFGFY